MPSIFETFGMGPDEQVVVGKPQAPTTSLSVGPQSILGTAAQQVHTTPAGAPVEEEPSFLDTVMEAFQPPAPVENPAIPVQQQPQPQQAPSPEMVAAAESAAKLKAGQGTAADGVKVAEIHKGNATPEQRDEAEKTVKKTFSTGDKNDDDFFDQMNDQFDMMTVGLTLMATSGNGKGLAPNLGLALQAGRQAKIKAAEASGAATKAKLGLAKTAAEIAKLNAESNKLLSEATGGKVKSPNATQIAVEGDFLKSLTGEDTFNKSTASYASSLRQRLIAQGISDKNQQDRFITERLQQDGFLEEGMFSGLNPVEDSSRLGF